MGALRHEPPIHAVAMDYFHGLQTAYAGLHRLGHRRIGLVLREDLEARTGHLWLGAYLSIGRPALNPLLFKGTDSTGNVFKRWRAVQRPDAVLTIHGEWCERLERAESNSLQGCPFQGFSFIVLRSAIRMGES
jgi:LacI family transcriptional regulator